MAQEPSERNGRTLEKLGPVLSFKSNNQASQEASWYQRRVTEDVFQYIDIPDTRYRLEEPTTSMYEKQHEEQVRIFQMPQQSPEESERPYNQQHAPFLKASKKSPEKDKSEPAPQLEHRIRYEK